MSGASENTVVDQEPIKLALAAGPLNAEQRAEAVRMLRHQSTVFAHVSEKYLQEVAKRMLVVMCPKESALIKQGDTQDRMFVVSQGEVHRIRLEPDGTRHHMDTYAPVYVRAAPAALGRIKFQRACSYGRQETKATFGALHFLKQDPSFATAKCVEDARAYMMTTTHFKEMLKDSKFSEEVIYSLSREVRG
jgi:CRP-like cAMP-binding protein